MQEKPNLLDGPGKRIIANASTCDKMYCDTASSVLRRLEMKTRNLLLLFYVLTAISLGCLPVMSLRPLHDKDDPDETWQFERVDDSNQQYQLTMTDEDGRKGVFTAKLVKLENCLVLDVYPEKFPSGEHKAEDMNLPYNSFLFFPVHTFVKVDFLTAIDDVGKYIEVPDPNVLKRLSKNYDCAMRLMLTKSDDFKKILEQDPNAVPHEQIENYGIILTASTKQLQKFVVKYADHEEFFSDDTELIRRKDSGKSLPSPRPKKQKKQ
jgi:hypothetical protein